MDYINIFTSLYLEYKYFIWKAVITLIVSINNCDTFLKVTHKVTFFWQYVCVCQDGSGKQYWAMIKNCLPCDEEQAF